MKIIRNRKGISDVGWLMIMIMVFVSMICMGISYEAYLKNDLEKAKLLTNITSQPVNVEKTK